MELLRRKILLGVSALAASGMLSNSLSNAHKKNLFNILKNFEFNVINNSQYYVGNMNVSETRWTKPINIFHSPR